MAQRGVELLERADELARISERIEAAVGGHGSGVVIGGSAGIGKTSLLDAGRDLAADAGMRVLAARAGQLEGDLAWNVVRQLFTSTVRAERELLSDAAELAAPALGLGSGSDAGALHGLYWLISNLSAETPVMLAVDDVQWTDPSSLRFLAYIAERAEDVNVLVAVTVRTGADDRGPVPTLASRPGAEVIAIHELSPGGSAELVRATLGPDSNDEFCEACHGATAGNPFLLRELVTQMASDGVPPTAEGAAQVTRITPDTVTRSVLVRLSQLSAESRELALAVGVLGAGAGVDEAAKLAELDPAAAATAADTLAESDILRRGTPLEFVHPIVREVVYDEMPPVQRAHRHLEAARLLAKSGADPERVATQLLEVEPGSDDWVVERLIEAARAAQSEGAVPSAATYLRRALEESMADERRIEVLRTLGTAESTFDLEAAATHLQQALELSSDPVKRGEIACELAQALVFTLAFKRADDVLAQGLEDVGDRDRDLRLRLEGIRAGVGPQDPDLRAASVERLRELLPEVVEGRTHEERVVLALAASATVAGIGDARDAAEYSRRALAGGRLLDELGAESYSFWYAPSGLLLAGAYGECEGVASEALAQAEARGSVLGVSLAHWALAAAHHRAGRVAEAEADALQSIDAGIPAGGPGVLFAAQVLSDAALDRGEPQIALDVLGRIGALGELPPLFGPAHVLHSRGRLRLAVGETESGLEDIREGCRVIEVFEYGSGLFPFRSQTALALAAAGERDEPARLVSEELELAREYGAPRAIGLALRADGLLKSGDAQLEALAESVDVLSASEARLDHGRALIDFGAALRRANRRREAIDRLQEGFEIAQECGALALVEQAREELDVAGAKPQRDRIEAASTLTPSELRVCTMAADGATNRDIAAALFVSLRTVETHLTHAYRKLDIGSRRELAAALAARESQPA